ncbi:MAG: hypothetical protein ACRERS_06130 [Methylococcales bacterium]
MTALAPREMIGIAVSLPFCVARGESKVGRASAANARNPIERIRDGGWISEAHPPNEGKRTTLPKNFLTRSEK